MDLDSAAADPDAAAFRELRRLHELRHAEHPDVEPPAFSLDARRNRDLHVIEPQHGAHAAVSTRAAALPPRGGGLGWGKPRSGFPPNSAGHRAGSRFARYRTALSRRTPPRPSREGREGVALVPCGSSRALMPHHLLLDRAEDRAA